ncbi:MAG: DEAD/DEAH box helicase [Rhodocyclaceae bacterium]|nr:DEAD/DEAH box helicase [Rhodocyclaceae bacterium]
MPLASLIRQLDDEQLGEFFSSSALQRARGFVARVEGLEAAGNQLAARVRGDGSAAFKVRVKVELREFLGQRSLEIGTRCSCPVVNRCPHAAAVLMAARRPDAISARPRDEIVAWARGLGTRLARAAEERGRGTGREALFYVVRRAVHGPDLELSLQKGRCDEAGGLAGSGSEWRNYEAALLKPPAFLADEDLEALRRYRDLARRHPAPGAARLIGREGALLAELALATGRCLLAMGRDAPRPVGSAGDRAGHLAWVPGEHGLRAEVASEPPCAFIARTRPMLYFDPGAGEAGRLVLPAPAVVGELLNLPPLSPSEVPVVAEALARHAAELPPPRAADDAEPVPLDAACQPVLTVSTLDCRRWRAHRGYPRSHAAGTAIDALPYDYALPIFRYGDARFVPGSGNQLATLGDGRRVTVQRDHAAEARALAALEAAGFLPIRPGWLETRGEMPPGLYGLDSESAWARFLPELAPALHAAGWEVACPHDFRHRVLLPEAWHAGVAEAEPGWLSLTLGIDVGGRRTDLAPLLHAAFHADPRWLDPAAVRAMDADEALVVQLEDGTRVALPVARLRPLALTLIDLFDRPGESPRLAAMDAGRLAPALAEGWQVDGEALLAQWLERVRALGEIQPVAPPEALQAELRPYQQAGLAWLQHLRRSALAGILADDMGLGKTVQVLAHLLVEQAAGRLDRPVLVVVPTSLVFNWREEARRFAPSLRVLELRGSRRAALFEGIPEHELCLTTYPLLWRDRERLAAYRYHSLILDEAQTVKNAASQAAQVVRALDAGHRLCLTGTPLENHLGELWAQFDFLMPGLLGDARDFTARWRTPIEKHGDRTRADLLARRLAPFILRRRKQTVASELPPKSVVVHSVELAGRQRDLYETVRATMDARVRDEVAARGFSRSRIVILEALLKLRQVCCDPRLLPSAAAAAVRERAKLDLLMAMLPELVEEGRSVLVFSQFTAMLDLIEPELRQRRIDWVRLSGDTRDRETPVRRFQQGEVPVFLISLKAGGTGLNLTAADTVIHFDPWWNPAIEAQATDRAHRLGQDKPVFVYKLVVAGSIEERILTLQARKAALAAGILSDDRNAALHFDEEDLAALLSPLPELPGKPARTSRR